ncbi:hypothetical protein LTS13_008144 [Exophiala xenobiotica]|nr:hypothetical protein LTS13_008144 [Exophiala xenobiotica]KAK5395000.1 hypothetical protein LTR79_007616 [Exophiala xenobiotica]KAK5491510.1 hypothetical protein LTR83_006351 [Exophiala xenobiotica]KAK5516975.1 hypothetical protein LTR07_006757 [Exophiala xenobiotica]
MEPESSDSDVSVGGGEDYRFASPLTAPIPLPPPPSKHALESADAVQARLDELSRVETHNDKKYDLLKAKRQRKDEKIRRRREAQDKKWATILDARQRRDARIAARRKREDAAFTQFFEHDLDEEETNLRRRLKRLKRGLPLDESPKAGMRNVSGPSMSPPSSLPAVPPPAKRHQVGPPGHPDSVNPSQSRPAAQSSLSASSTKSGLSAPPYSFYRDPGSAFSRPYQHGPYSTTPNASSPKTTTNGLPQGPPDRNSDRPGLGLLGRPSSPHSRPGTNAQSPVTPATNAASQPPRQTSSSYDTRPPPTTTSSGFASINAPPPSGFASVNARSTATPPASHAGLARPAADTEANRTPVGPAGNNGVDRDRFQQYGATPTSAPSPAASNSGSKRTPSTTHPYQMSEAFANRHHHCERVDSLNRGIWTSYGVGGTADNPTGPAVEMYLRCNHEGCSRIDWRTVHGLQCHIVKNHAQPKGTIGSLDKALERYGVPIKEVEEHELKHGRGSGGTMADPKNHKIKTKTKEALGGLETRPYIRKETPGSYDPDTRPAGYRPSPTTASPALSDEIKRSPATIASMNGSKPFSATTDEAKRSAPQMAGQSPVNVFSAVRHDWYRPGPFSSGPPPKPEPKSLQGDFGASEAARKEQQPLLTQSGAELSNGFQSKSPSLNTLPPRPQPSSTITVGAASAVAGVPGADEKMTNAPTQSTPAAIVQAETTEAKSDSPADAPKQDASVPKPSLTDGDVQMTGTDEPSEKKAEEKLDSTPATTTVESEKKPASEAVPATTKTEAELEVPAKHAEDESEDQSETIVVDGDAGKDASAAKRNTNPTFQSPVMTTRSVQASAATATTPGSATRRGSRRSSVARKSVDHEMDGYNDGKGEKEKENEEEKEGSKDENKVERETRRSMAGRLLRRGR